MSYGTFEDETVHAWLACVRDNAWVSLHYESPALSVTSRGEISGGGYVRRNANFSVPASRAMWLLEDVIFTGLLENRLTHFGIWNAKSAGKLKAYGLLTPDGSEVRILDGNGYVLHAGDLALSIQ